MARPRINPAVLHRLMKRARNHARRRKKKSPSRVAGTATPTRR